MNAVSITDQATQRRPVKTSPAVERQQALQEAYDRHVEQIYKFVYFKVGNREDAEDITSQIFIKAATSLDTTQEEHVQLAWLYQVARTTVTDHWRSYYKGPTSSLDAMEEKNPLHLAAGPLVTEDNSADLESSETKVREILATLPENYRRVLELRFLQGCSLKETAEALGITEGNVKVIQHRALQKATKTGARFM